MSSVCLTSYFVTKYDTNREMQWLSDDFDMIREYYNSVDKNGISTLVFIDNCSQKFIDKYKTENVSFHKTYIGYSHMHPHDIRFIKFYEYILNHPEIENIVMTDITDVTILKDPFPLINREDLDTLFIGKENDKIYENAWMDNYLNFIQTVFGNDILNYDKFKDRLMLNCGIIAGKREIIIELLRKIVDMMSAIYGTHKNIHKPLDMFLVNYIVYTDYHANLYNGHNLHTKFGHYETDTEGKYFKHK